MIPMEFARNDPYAPSALSACSFFSGAGHLLLRRHPRHSLFQLGDLSGQRQRGGMQHDVTSGVSVVLVLRTQGSSLVSFVGLETRTTTFR